MLTKVYNNIPIPFNTNFGNEIRELYQEFPDDFKSLIAGMAGCSPYLYGLLTEYKDWLSKKLPKANDDIIKELKGDLYDTIDLQKTLRISKSKMALWTAICDIGGVWSLDEVTVKLTEFADLVVQRTMEFEFQNSNKLKKILKNGQKIEGSGWVALAMGKMGAFELNYSSDIDLIFLFDETVYFQEQYEEVRMGFIQMTRAVNKMINETTDDGYVFRTDFRLRPNPSVTPICLSMDSAIRYYESSGRAWERAAFIKARACAGDVRAGEKFLKKLQPFIWRKYLDFAAIKDAHDIRQKIKSNNLNRDSGDILGSNIKLIEGGIRDIEFYAQTRQIIAGGRDNKLRSAKTCQALVDLSNSGWLDRHDLVVLTKAYKDYRILEHRLQMVNDVQTHNLPSTEPNFKRICCFMGIKNNIKFKNEIEQNLELVCKITRDFFTPISEENTISDEYLELSDEWLSYPALRSDRAKEVFRSIRPIIIKKALDSGNPDLTLRRFTKFLEGLPSGVQLFSLFAANNELIDLLLDICTSGVKLSTYLAQNAKIFDSVLDGDFFEEIKFDAHFFELLDGRLRNATDYEDKLKIARAFNNELHFRISVQYLSGLIRAEQVSFLYSKLADNILTTVWSLCCKDFELIHGKLPGEGAILLGMGSLGAQSMNANSDIDLIVIYDAKSNTSSNGNKPLDIPVYYSRLTKKFLTAVSVKMENGELYKVDMRLRPSGNKGPVAASFGSFKKYQMNDAWIWERLAFSRSRVVCGNKKLHKNFNLFREKFLEKKINRTKVFKEIAIMREKIKNNNIHFEFPWDLKKGPGNLMDLELLGQGCAICLNLKSQDSKLHLSSLNELGSWSLIEEKKIYELYFLMSNLRQVIAVIGDYKDFDTQDAKFIHNLVIRETGVANIDKLRENLSNLREWASNTIDAKLEEYLNG